MPCSGDGYAEYEARERLRKVNMLTNMLCEVCSQATNLPVHIDAWYKAHLQEDKLKEERKVREKEQTRLNLIALKAQIEHELSKMKD